MTSPVNPNGFDASPADQATQEAPAATEEAPAAEQQ